jgi:hypothetical protein
MLKIDFLLGIIIKQQINAYKEKLADIEELQVALAAEWEN